jgi:hypothetical protein
MKRPRLTVIAGCALVLALTVLVVWTTGRSDGRLVCHLPVDPKHHIVLCDESPDGKCLLINTGRHLSPDGMGFTAARALRVDVRKGRAAELSFRGTHVKRFLADGRVFLIGKKTGSLYAGDPETGEHSPIFLRPGRGSIWRPVYHEKTGHVAYVKAQVDATGGWPRYDGRGVSIASVTDPESATELSLPPGGGRYKPLHWSSDGQVLTVGRQLSFRVGGPELLAYDLSGKLLTTAKGYGGGTVCLSPHGGRQWYAEWGPGPGPPFFISHRTTGGPEATLRLPVPDGWAPLEFSSDGRYVQIERQGYGSLTSPREIGLRLSYHLHRTLLRLSTGDARPVVGGQTRVASLPDMSMRDVGWVRDALFSRDGSKLYYLRGRDIWVMELDQGK